ncbi:hypothetical protein [Ectopseudomonas hydrolytica]|uniref:hypothetical protein n=1 Tax=Ectopseudomonas hydrolytica TaxID=2493633 RepID=UPI00376F2536
MSLMSLIRRTTSSLRQSLLARPMMRWRRSYRGRGQGDHRGIRQRVVIGGAPQQWLGQRQIARLIAGQQVAIPVQAPRIAALAQHFDAPVRRPVRVDSGGIGQCREMTGLEPQADAEDIAEVAQLLPQLRLQLGGIAAALQQLTEASEGFGVQLHASVVAVDTAEIGVEVVLDLAAAQLGHGALGIVQVERGHHPHRGQKQRHQQQHQEHQQPLGGARQAGQAGHQR